jgi:hypothetical protein
VNDTTPNLHSGEEATQVVLEKLRTDINNLMVEIQQIRGNINEIVTVVKDLNNKMNSNTSVPVTWVDHGQSNAWVINPVDGKAALLGFHANGNITWKFQ